MMIDRAALSAMLLSAAELMEENADRLSEIDSRFGDGDHGITIGKIARLIRQEVAALGSRAGGLTMIFGLYPGTPLQNVKALMDAMERYMGYYD